LSGAVPLDTEEIGKGTICSNCSVFYLTYLIIDWITTQKREEIQTLRIDRDPIVGHDPVDDVITQCDLFEYKIVFLMYLVRISCTILTNVDIEGWKDGEWNLAVTRHPVFQQAYRQFVYPTLPAGYQVVFDARNPQWCPHVALRVYY
jgi:hypothetical protein